MSAESAPDPSTDASEPLTEAEVQFVYDWAPGSRDGRKSMGDDLAVLLAAAATKARADALREAAEAIDAESERIGGMYAGDCSELLRRIARGDA